MIVPPPPPPPPPLSLPPHPAAPTVSSATTTIEPERPRIPAILDLRPSVVPLHRDVYGLPAWTTFQSVAVIKDTGRRAILPPFTEEHEELRETVSRFVRSEIAPHVEEWEAARE